MSADTPGLERMYVQKKTEYEKCLEECTKLKRASTALAVQLKLEQLIEPKLDAENNVIKPALKPSECHKRPNLLWREPAGWNFGYRGHDPKFAESARSLLECAYLLFNIHYECAGNCILYDLLQNMVDNAEHSFAAPDPEVNCILSPERILPQYMDRLSYNEERERRYNDNARWPIGADLDLAEHLLQDRQH
jgi:hypothetical protein